MRGGFQFGAFCHIYRGLGKSKLPYLFLSIPYRWTSKIGAIDHDFRHKIPVLEGDVSPWVTKTAIFDDF